MPAIMAGIVFPEPSSMSLRLLTVLCCSASIVGCTIVHMAPGADRVRVVDGAPAGCERRGEIDVTVRDSLVFYERKGRKVRDELETLARNEAPGLGADTVQPAAPPVEGEQRWIAWRCRK
jgi:hypothetical protein